MTIGAALVRSDIDRPYEAGLGVFGSVDDLIAWRPSLVVECAGHAAVAETVPKLLEVGLPVVVASIGALADASVRTRLRTAAARGASLSLVSGAVGGLDALRSARLTGLDEVVYSGVKPPRAWLGSPAEDAFELGSLSRPQVIFEGSASVAATLYPKNANVTAAIALAGLGFDDTKVTLIADPAARGNTHRIQARGPFGELDLRFENQPLPDNPKTSWLAALSVQQAVLQHFTPSDL